jgi:hypothetical protein
LAMFAGFPFWSAAGITRACCLLFEKSISRPPLEFATMLVQELDKNGEKATRTKESAEKGSNGEWKCRHKAQAWTQVGIRHSIPRERF